MDKDTEQKQAAGDSPAPPLEKTAEKETAEPGNNGYNPEEVFLQKAGVLLDAAMRKVPGEAKKALVDAIVEGINGPLVDRLAAIIVTLATQGRILSRLGPTLDLIEQNFDRLEQSSATRVGIHQEHRSVLERLGIMDQKFAGIGRAIEVLTRIAQKPAASEEQGG